MNEHEQENHEDEVVRQDKFEFATSIGVEKADVLYDELMGLGKDSLVRLKKRLDGRIKGMSEGWCEQGSNNE